MVCYSVSDLHSLVDDWQHVSAGYIIKKRLICVRQQQHFIGPRFWSNKPFPKNLVKLTTLDATCLNVYVALHLPLNHCSGFGDMNQ